MLISIISLWLVSTTIGPKAVAETKHQWEVLTNCSLVDAPFNDGDSFHISCNGKNYTFRLYSVDALETSETFMDRLKDQARYFDIRFDKVIEGGNLGKKFAHNFLQGKFNITTKWEDARGSSYHKRYFGIISKDQKYLSNELVLAGLARIYGKPIEDRWPNGIQPHTFYEKLRESELLAKKKERGLWAEVYKIDQFQTLKTKNSEIPSLSRSENFTKKIELSQSTSQININRASFSDLQKLPGIGPKLATRIVENRPFKTIDSLSTVSGISPKTVERLKKMIVVEGLVHPPHTADFYRANIDAHLNKEVSVQVESVIRSTSESPKSFCRVSLNTAYQGREGGLITAFIPEEFYESFLNYYSNPGRRFKGLLYQREGELILVYLRK